MHMYILIVVTPFSYLFPSLFLSHTVTVPHFISTLTQVNPKGEKFKPNINNTKQDGRHSYEDWMWSHLYCRDALHDPEVT